MKADGGARPYSSPLRAEQAAATRDRIVDATVALLRDGDPSAFGMQDVADRAGVSVRTVYRAFPTKDDLIAGVLAAINERLERVARAPARPPARVRSPRRRGTVVPASSSSSRSTGRSSPRRQAARRTGAPVPSGCAAIEAAFADDLAGLPAEQARRFAAALYLVTSSRSVFFLKDYAGFDVDDARSPSSGWCRAGRRAARPRPARTLGRRRRRADDHRVEGTGRRALGARDDARAGRPTPDLPGAGAAAHRPTGSAAPRPATGSRSTTSRCGSSTTTATPGCARSARRSRSRASRASAPPAFVLWLLARLHPELRRRAKAARRAIDAEGLARGSPALGGARPRRRCSPPTAPSRPSRLDQLDDDALVDHLRRAADNLERGIAMHLDADPRARRHRRSPAAGLPQRGASTTPRRSPSSAAARRRRRPRPPASPPSPEACRDAGVEPATLDDVRAASPEAAAALDGYLADHGWRAVTQYSPRGVCLVELPDLLARGHPGGGRRRRAAATGRPIRRRAGAGPRVPTGPGSTTSSPTPARATACATTTSPSPSSGRAGSCAGPCSRPAAAWPTRGLLRDDWHVFALGEDEIAAALARRRDPRATSQRRGPRTAMAAEADGAPLQLGDDEGPPPDPGPVPVGDGRAGARRSWSASSSSRRCSATPKDVAAWSGDGIGIGSTPYTGRACVVAVGRGRPRPAAGRRRPRHHAHHPRLRSDHADRRRRGRPSSAG